jgi:hypothetical protein
LGHGGETIASTNDVLRVWKADDGLQFECTVAGPSERSAARLFRDHKNLAASICCLPTKFSQHGRVIQIAAADLLHIALVPRSFYRGTAAHLAAGWVPVERRATSTPRARVTSKPLTREQQRQEAVQRMREDLSHPVGRQTLEQVLETNRMIRAMW